MKKMHSQITDSRCGITHRDSNLEFESVSAIPIPDDPSVTAAYWLPDKSTAAGKFKILVGCGKEAIF